MAPVTNLSRNSCTTLAIDPFSLPSLLNLLLNDQIHYFALAVFILAVTARSVNCFLPRSQLTLLDAALGDVNDMLLAVREDGMDHKFILDELQLAFEM